MNESIRELGFFIKNRVMPVKAFSFEDGEAIFCHRIVKRIVLMQCICCFFVALAYFALSFAVLVLAGSESVDLLPNQLFLYLAVTLKGCYLCFVNWQ